MVQSSIGNKKLALFFTQGVSLKTWHKKGYLSREVKIYKELSKRLGEVFFLTYGRNDHDFLDYLFNIEVIPNKWGLNSKVYSLLLPFLNWRLLKRIDVFKTNQMKGSWTAVLSKFLFRKPLVVRCGYEWARFIERKKPPVKLKLARVLERISYKYADKIILTSKSSKDYVMHNYKIEENKIEIVHNYIDTEKFRPLNGISTEEGRLCFVGRLDKQKNLFNLLKAIKNIPNIKLIIIGEGEQKEKLKRYAQDECLKIDFLGRIPNEKIPIELNKSDIFVFPSLYEGNPKALLEAMACGLPVIASNVEGIKELIYHKKNGYLCDTSADSIRQSILEVLGTQSLKKKMGYEARLFIEKNCCLKSLINREISILKDLFYGKVNGRL